MISNFILAEVLLNTENPTNIYWLQKGVQRFSPKLHPLAGEAGCIFWECQLDSPPEKILLPKSRLPSQDPPPVRYPDRLSIFLPLLVETGGCRDWSDVLLQIRGKALPLFIFYSVLMVYLHMMCPQHLPNYYHRASSLWHETLGNIYISYQ